MNYLENPGNYPIIKLMKKRKLKKWIVVSLSIFIALLLIIPALINYINNSFIHKHLKVFISRAISEYAQGRADIGRLRLSLKEGFILNDVKIYSGAEEELLLSAERACFNIIFIPSFSRQKIIIPVLRIYRPHAGIHRRPDTGWDLAFISRAAKEGKKPPFLSVLLHSITFEDGIIDFSDSHAINTFKKQLTKLRGNIVFPGALTVKCGGQTDGCDFYISGKCLPDNGKLIFEIEAENLDPRDIARAYIDSGICRISRANISGYAKGSAHEGYISLTECNIFAEDIDAIIDGIHVSGDHNLRGKAAFHVNDIKNIKYCFDAAIDNAGFGIKDNTLLEHISDIKANIELTNAIWRVKELSCLIYGSKAQIRGHIKNPAEDYIAQANLKTQIDLKVITGKNNIPINGGTASIDLNITCDKTGSFSLEGKSAIKDMDITLDNFSLNGNFSIMAEASGVLDNWQASGYKGAVIFDNTHISGVGNLPSVYNASGEATFTDNLISIKKLSGIVSDTDISLSGDITYKNDAHGADLRLIADSVPLPRLISLLPDRTLKWFEGIELSGDCSLDARFKGGLNVTDSHSYEGSVTVKKASAVLNSWPYRISDISSDIGLKDRDILWHKMDFTIADKRYSSDGKISNLAKPSITAVISSESLNLDIETGPIDNNTIPISRLNGKYQGLTFSLKGGINTLSRPRLDISGQARLDLKSLTHIVARSIKPAKNMDIDGAIRLGIDIEGPLNRPIDWTVFVEGTSENLRVNDFTFKDVYLDYRMKDRFVDIPVLSLCAYDGIVNMSGRANLKTEERPFMINLDMKDIDLHKLVSEAKGADKKIKGLLSSKVVLNGYMNNKDSLKGNGWLQVADGYLWEFPVLRGIMNILLMEPPEYIILTDAFGNFIIERNRIYTEDFKMLSKSASLLWEGSIGLDSSLDFNITGRFAEGIIKQTSEPGRIKSAVLREAGNLIMGIHLTGNLENPNYQIVPFPLQKIFHNKIVNTISDIFGNIQE